MCFRLTPTRSNFVNQHLLSHQGVLSQAQAIISRAEAATAAALNTQQQKFPSAAAAAAATGSLERSTSNVSSVVHGKRELPLLPSDALGIVILSEQKSFILTKEGLKEAYILDMFLIYKDP